MALRAYTEIILWVVVDFRAASAEAPTVDDFDLVAWDHLLAANAAPRILPDLGRWLLVSVTARRAEKVSIDDYRVASWEPYKASRADDIARSIGDLKGLVIVEMSNLNFINI